MELDVLRDANSVYAISEAGYAPWPYWRSHTVGRPGKPAGGG